MVVTSNLSDTGRGAGGFGSSDVAVRSVRATQEALHRGEDLLPEQELHDRGQPRRDGPGRESGGFVHARESGRVETSRALPDSLFFETFTSRGGETMQTFLERLGGAELQFASWLLAESVLRVVANMPVNDRPQEVMVHFPQALVILKIHGHCAWRMKLFDSDMSVPPAASGLGAGVITIAWLEDGRKMIRSDLRKGSHSMHYLQQRWFGYSILLRVTEVRRDVAGTGSC